MDTLFPKPRPDEYTGIHQRILWVHNLFGRHIYFNTSYNIRSGDDVSTFYHKKKKERLKGGIQIWVKTTWLE